MSSVLLSAYICVLASPPMESSKNGTRESAERHVDEVEVIELNRFCEDGMCVFAQLLFWSTYPESGLHIRDWRLLKHKSMIPKKHGDKWETRWERNGVTYVVTANEFKETRTNFDPDQRDREVIPKKHRKKLFESSARPMGKLPKERN